MSTYYPNGKLAASAPAAAAAAAATINKEKPVARNLSDEIAGVPCDGEGKKKKEGFEEGKENDKKTNARVGFLDAT